VLPQPYVSYDAYAHQVFSFSAPCAPLQESKGSVAVRMALGETQIVQETRQFLLENCVCLDSFSQVSSMLICVLNSVPFVSV